MATTSAATHGTVVFVEKHPDVPLPPYDAKRNITYVETTLTTEHILASAAIPVAFLPVRIAQPAAWRGWYVDGGLRLNAPIKPALALGGTHVAVVATHPRDYPPAQQPTQREQAKPDVVAAFAHVLRGALADRMVEDLHTLATVNSLLKKHPQPPRHGDGRPFRAVQVAFAGPPPAEDGSIGRLALRMFHEEVRNLGGVLRHGNLWLLSRMIGGRRADHGELLSYLYFDRAFTAEAAKLGVKHVHDNPPRMQTPS